MRRGKTTKQPAEKDGSISQSSKILSEILETLDLTFDKDLGMLDGRSIRYIPEKSILITFKNQLEILGTSLEEIIKNDQEMVNLIRETKDSIIKKEVCTLKNPINVITKDNNGRDEPESTMSKVPMKKKPLESQEEDNKKLENVHEKMVIQNDMLSDEIHISKKVKLESDYVENDPNVKNPNSEFVISQTLPKAAMQLGLFSEQCLESTGDDYFKKKYGVSSYPLNNLKDLLPGQIPDMDFSKPKPTSQIQYSTFLTSIEPFFREFTDDDIKFLQNKYIIPQNLQRPKTYDPNITPYIIPKLGPLYTDTWLKEDNQNIANLTPPPINDSESILPKKGPDSLSDSMLETEGISCGPLVSRLLSAVLKDTEKDLISVKNENEHVENSTNVNNNEQNQLAADTSIKTGTKELDNHKNTIFSSSIFPQHQGWATTSINLDYTSFEERLKRELKYVGIYMNLPKDENGSDDPDWLNGREDDEISAELRELQTNLKQVTKRNQNRKSLLIPLVERQLAWQEYESILDDLDKQVDQVYIKRIRVPKNKKKKNQNELVTSTQSMFSGPTSQVALQAAHQQAANSSLKSLLDKRQKWIQKIGPLFDKPEIMKHIPKESVFKDLDQEEEEEEADVFGNIRNRKEDELTDSLQNKD